ncbi:hypothetical protein Taro_014406 [Colocasia esculenta]|uniref:Uncharacterized protein n=1 Tax=Colocasia esculenta TaxID=4460 RepID=A0A843UQ18_COLES|nr:hypothetical protein [Colocasia esculenta]
MYNQITCRFPAFAFASSTAFIFASSCAFKMKFEPQDVTRSIIKALLQYLPGPIAQWKEYPREEKEKGGHVSYKELFEHTHRRKNTGDFVSKKSKEVMETYAKQMVDKYGADSTQHPEFDAMAWLAAIGEPKKG